MCFFPIFLQRGSRLDSGHHDERDGDDDGDDGDDDNDGDDGDDNLSDYFPDIKPVL